MITHAKLHEILAANSFLMAMTEHADNHPFIVVFRETGRTNNSEPEPCADDGTNNCDSILLVGHRDDPIVPLEGRSLPHDRYQARMVAGTQRANYIATGHYYRCWMKGHHYAGGRDYGPALRQVQKFQIWRSRDMDLGDDDDYSELDLVGDNFHGMAPWSAGCVTVEGRMTPARTGQWAYAVNWLYHDHDYRQYFSAVILNHSDLDAPRRLRIGSVGNGVQRVQEALVQAALPTVPDSHFGPHVFDQVREFQRQHDLKDDGIVGPETAAAMAFYTGQDPLGY